MHWARARRGVSKASRNLTVRYGKRVVERDTRDMSMEMKVREWERERGGLVGHGAHASDPGRPRADSASDGTLSRCELVT